MAALTPSSGTVLVTGASGLVGGHVCGCLRSRGYQVRAAVRDPPADKVRFLLDMGCALARVPDLLSDEGWAEAMDGCVGLVHVASPVQMAAAGDTPDENIVEQAVAGSERALRFAAASGTVRRVVVTATMASVCGTQRETNPDHLWSEADTNDAPESAYSKSKTAAEAKVWEMAAAHKDKFSVTTVHPAVVLGPMLEGQGVSSTMGYLKMMLTGTVMPMMFGLCSAADVAAVHLAGLEKKETSGQRYLVCSTDQYSTLELVEMAKEGAPEACAGLDLAAWRADGRVAALRPKKPATDNRKACALLGVDALEPPRKFVAEAAASLKRTSAL
mmetsp:Transcript_90862/g.257384  ORF Transcript_90862/g.257384 Transcript_90862/m.257384 type:complete len:330 (-) Transcript_90862:160-1149(-)